MKSFLAHAKIMRKLQESAHHFHLLYLGIVRSCLGNRRGSSLFRKIITNNNRIITNFNHQIAQQLTPKIKNYNLNKNRVQ